MGSRQDGNLSTDELSHKGMTTMMTHAWILGDVDVTRFDKRTRATRVALASGDLTFDDGTNYPPIFDPKEDNDNDR